MLVPKNAVVLLRIGSEHAMVQVVRVIIVNGKRVIPKHVFGLIGCR
jgi:hypothetical protein